MAIGSQFICTKSFHSLNLNTEYYFAGRRPTGSVILVSFFKSTNTWKARTLEILTNDFDLLTREGILTLAERQRSLPVWLEAVEFINFEEIEGARYGGKKSSYRTIVDSRLTWISEAADNYSAILNARDISKEIACFRRKQGNVNRSRFSLWFWAFALHGNNRWALMPPFQNCGTWSRDAAKHHHKKFGRQALAETSFNSPSHLCSELCIKGFLRFCRSTKTLVEIHRLTLIKIFKVSTVITESGGYRLSHPLNAPFPSLYQFRYRVMKGLGEDVYFQKLYGTKHLRRNAIHNVGQFLNAHLNILDTLVTDAFTVEQIPRGLGTADAVELLYVVIGKCPTTSAKVGVGFSLGGERAEAYRSMLFCCVASRDLIEEIYGLPPGSLNLWIAQGLSRAYVSDRGPGASVRPGDDQDYFQLSRGEIIPSLDGQGNAVIEASHPRERRLEGHEERALSKLNVIEHIKLEILRAVLYNESSDVTDRLSPEAVQHFLHENIAPTPHGYWKYLDQRHCTNAVQINNHNAIRSFLKKVEFTLLANGVKLAERIYTSENLISSRFFRAAQRGLKVTGYVVPCSVRIAWIEIEGELIKVTTRGTLRTQDDEQQATLSEAAVEEQARKRLKSSVRQQSSAASVYFKEVFTKETGKDWLDNEKAPTGKRVKRARKTTDKVVISGSARAES